MEFLAVLIVLVFIGIGYLLMGGIDHFLEKTFPETPPVSPETCAALIFGELNRPEALEQLMLRRHIAYLKLTEPHVPDHLKLRLVLAVSGSDLDNLMLCNEARHVNPDVITIAKCSNSIYREIFEKAGISRILTDAMFDDNILQAVVASI